MTAVNQDGTAILRRPTFVMSQPVDESPSRTFVARTCSPRASPTALGAGVVLAGTARVPSENVCCSRSGPAEEERTFAPFRRRDELRWRRSEVVVVGI